MRPSWHHSKFANWVRGTPEPTLFTLGSWDNWEKEAKDAHPIRFYVVQTMFPLIERVVKSPFTVYHAVSYWYRCAFVYKTHVLPTGCKFGTWRDTDSRLLHGAFSALVLFVEKEIPQYRNVDDGIAYLRKMANMTVGEHMGGDASDATFNDLLPGANNYQEIIDLYTWWTVERPTERAAISDLSEGSTRYDKDTEMLLRLVRVRHYLWT